MKKILVFIGLAVLVAAVVGAAGCKNTEYDITGSWEITLSRAGEDLAVNVYIFTGTLKEGAAEVEGINSTGEYSVSGDIVSFNVSYGIAAPLFSENFSGSFDSTDTMRGNFTITLDGDVTESGSWTATR